MYSHFLGVEICVGPLLCMVLPLELGDWSGTPDAHVIGVEIGVNDQLSIVDQACIVNRCKIRECALYAG